MGFVYSFIASTVVMLTLNYYFTRKYINLDLQILKDFIFPIISAILMCFTIAYVRHIILGHSETNIAFFIEMVSGLLVYVIAIISLGCIRFSSVKNILLNNQKMKKRSN
mgnify:CR=1 FL=1